MDPQILSFFILGKSSNSDTERSGKSVRQSWRRRRIWHVTEKETFLLPYFGSYLQGDLLKSSTFPKEVGHLVTFIFIERQNLAVARLVSNFCFPEVVKSLLRSSMDPHDSGDSVKYNHWNSNKCSSKAVKVLITCHELVYFPLLRCWSRLQSAAVRTHLCRTISHVSQTSTDKSELSKHPSYSPWLKKKMVGWYKYFSIWNLFCEDYRISCE